MKSSDAMPGSVEQKVSVGLFANHQRWVKMNFFRVSWWVEFSNRPPS